jgi:hypothetical protein
MKNLINLVLLFVGSSALQAQTDFLNQKKYWFYHYRLVNDFMVVGDCKGCSEPMNERGSGSYDSKIAKWGDQTISLGHYIAVLATEYKLLSDQNQPTDTTIKELYYAIRAFNRLDESAEANIPGATHLPQPSDINGFFIRDDVNSDFLIQHPKLATGVTSTRQVNSLESDFIDATTTVKEMSHDQIWYLFTGFALVRKCLPESVPITYQGLPLNDLDGNVDIREEALNITNRIMNLLKTHSWLIRNPNTGSTVFRGWYVQELSYGAAEAACFINNPNNTTVSMLPVIHTCNSYHDVISLADAPLWMNFGKGIGNLITISVEDYKLQQISAIGNSWYSSAIIVVPDPITVIQQIFNYHNLLHPWQFISSIIQNPPIYPNNITTTALGTRAIIRDNQHLPLLRQVLHGGGNLIPKSTYVNLLNSAPCNGPYCFQKSTGDCATFEWSAWDRLHFSEERGGKSLEGEYNGLDYLLYYNLYHIIEGNTVPEINYMNQTVSNPFPTTGPFPVGTAAMPAIIEGFNSITASNIVNSNAVVTYHAGNEITLLPGFSAEAGSNFSAYINPFHCAADGTYK